MNHNTYLVGVVFSGIGSGLWGGCFGGLCLNQLILAPLFYLAYPLKKSLAALSVDYLSYYTLSTSELFNLCPNTFADLLC